MFGIQDPTYADAVYLQNLLRTACRGAVAGGGAYAFASKGGIRMTLGDKSFAPLLEKGRFSLVIGMDDITNTAALDELEKLSRRYPGRLTVRAYIHGDDGSTFHPKFSWFKKADGSGVLVLGSGNLTQAGMNLNREAYSVVTCGTERIDEVIAEWRRWYAHSAPFLFDTDDAVVRIKARWNEEKLRVTTAAKLDFEEEAANRPDIARLKEVYKNQPKSPLIKARPRPAAPKGEDRAFARGQKASSRRTALRAKVKKRVLRLTARRYRRK